ncbi:WxL domain-containing protein [Lacticaseibacillus saniviri]
MKTTKLISLTTLASAALLAIAPAAGVHAASGYNINGTEDPTNGLPTYKDADLQSNVTNPDPNDKTKATADPTKGMGANDKANQKTGTAASAQSEAWAHVTAGYLTLDAVPDLHFGTVVAGMQAGLFDNESIRSNDGNDQGLLQVTDSRVKVDGTGATETPAVNGLGYVLSAKLGDFNGYSTYDKAKNDAAGTNADLPAVTGWTLALSNDGGLVDTTNAPVTDTANALKDPTLEAGGAGQAVILTQEGTAFGTVRHSYIKNSDATLNVPGGVQKGWYVANLTWTLNADASAAVN